MKRLTGTMIDSETLSLTPRALVWEIAAIPFSIVIEEDGVRWEEDGDPFHTLINYKGLETDGFDVNLKTVAWTDEQRFGDPAWSHWKDQHFNPSGPKSYNPETDPTYSRPADAFAVIAGRAGDRPVWFRNAAFDVPCLAHLGATFNTTLPWSRRAQSDIYTLANVAKELHGFKDGVKSYGVHSALEDARLQIEQLCRLCDVLYRPGVASDPHMGSASL